MKKFNIRRIAVCIVILLVTAAVCIGAFYRSFRQDSASSVQSGVSGPAAPVQPNPAAPYLNAVSHLKASKGYRMEVTTVKQIVLANQVLTETSEKSIACMAYGTDKMQVSMDETVDYGSHSFSVSERYQDGAAYFTICNGKFPVQLTADQYLKRMTPVQILDPSLYRNIRSRQSGDILEIGFTQPIQPEAWAYQPDAQMISGSGRVALDSRGNLIQSRYSLTFRQAGTQMDLAIRINFKPLEPDAFPPIQIPDSYVSIANIDALRLLETSTGFILQADTLYSHKEETVNCTAGNLQRTQTTDLILENADSDLDAAVRTTVVLSDGNSASASQRHGQREIFKDGAYSLELLEGGEPSQGIQQVNAATMVKYCRDILVGSIILPEFVSGVAIQEIDGKYRITFPAIPELGELMCADACNTLYQDPEALNQAATSYSTTRMEGILEIDKTTSLPVSSKLLYSGTHIIEEIPYELTSDVVQTYRFTQE